MSKDDYMQSRMIYTPLRMFDCDVHCDASTAIVLSRRDAARDTRQPPIRIEAIGSSMRWAFAIVPLCDFDEEAGKLEFDQRLNEWEQDARLVLNRELRHTIQKISPDAVPAKPDAAGSGL